MTFCLYITFKGILFLRNSNVKCVTKHLVQKDLTENFQATAASEK